MRNIVTGLARLASFVGLAAAIAFTPTASLAQDGKWRHASSLFGEPKYPDGFSYFDYVNVDAPKGGTVRLATIGTFDSLNPFTFKGRAAGLVGLIYDTLMESSMDEPSSEYGLIAEAVWFPDDYSSVTYRLRPQARWHDGTPITVDDVIFSLEALKKSHPFYAAYYKNIVSAEQTGEREVTFTFDQTGNRELPQITGQLTILPKAWWTGTDANGDPRDITASTLEVPLGSGPYRVKQVQPGRSITIERVEDYWGANLPVKIGSDNFDEIRQEYFRDDTVALEAFKGDQYDWRIESSSKNWATAYDFPAVRDGRVVLEELKTQQGQGMQAFAFNTRQAKFQDRRVRKAFSLAFDFEWANKNLFFGQYTRTESFFSNTELAARELPGELELEILEPLRGKVPDEVFTKVYEAPVNEKPGDLRANLRAATRLLREAGWQIQDGVLTNAQSGEKMEVEFLLVSPLFERIVLPYTKNLERLGIKASVRTIDPAQYQNRLDGFDFDIVVGNWGQSLSPGNEQRDMWGSEAANRNGSRNLVGIADEAVDYLIDRLVFAKDREELVAATRALDRVLLWNNYVVPQWHIPIIRTARWDRFGRPEKLPEYSIGFPTIWWWKGDAAASQ